MSSYLERLRNSNADNLKKFKEQTAAAGAGGFAKDETFWVAKPDATGTGTAKFRFLPMAEGEESPFVFYFQHFFKENGKFFVEKCPNTFGFDHGCSVCDDVQPLWDGSEDEKAIAMRRARKKNYVANIYMIEDQMNPANNGKVFKYRFGASIFEIIQKVMDPEDVDDEAVNVFSLFEDGANFRLKVKQKGGFANYDDSKFLSVGPLDVADDELEKIVDSIYPLEPIIAKDQFKSNDELLKRFYNVIGKTSPVSTTVATTKVETPSSSETNVKPAVSVEDTSTSEVKVDDYDFSALTFDDD